MPRTLNDEDLEPEVLELRSRWRLSGLTTAKVAELTGLSIGSVSHALTGRIKGRSLRTIEELFTSIENPQRLASAGDDKASPFVHEKPQIATEAPPVAKEIVELNGHILPEPIDRLEQIANTTKDLAAAAANVVGLRRLAREAELEYNVLIRKATSVGIRIEEV